MIALTRATAAEYGPEGIRANGVGPGWIEGTRLGEDEVAGIDVAPIRAELASRTPARRRGTPEEVAAVALYLSSPAASFVNGAILEADGGWLAI